MRQGGGALFLIAQMREDSVDDAQVFDTGDDPYRSTAAATDLDVYTEDAFKALRPGNMPLRNVSPHGADDLTPRGRQV